MLTSSEKAFIREWEEQREGPKWKYYAQYWTAWTFVVFFGIFFPSKIFSPDNSFGGLQGLMILIVIAVVLGVVPTHLIYTRNERRYSKLKKRLEGAEGKYN
jgi:hypothetical protein